MIKSYYTVETLTKVLGKSICLDSELEKIFEEATKIYNYVELKNVTENNGIYKSSSIKISAR